MVRTYVFVARIPETCDVCEVYPPERSAEIFACSSERVRREKFFVWRLLERAVFELVGAPLEKLSPRKLESGRWVCNGCFFSLSHSRGVAAVAVSERDVGVDVEEICRRADGIEHRILTDAERAELVRLDAAMREEYIIEKWTQKEALFKRSSESCFKPSMTETDGKDVRTWGVEYDGTRYALSVASEDIENLRINIL